VGIGLCGSHGVTRGLPFDVLGLLAAAEVARQSVGAERVEVLIADTHARAAGHPPRLVAFAANRVLALLGRLAQLGWTTLRPLRASTLACEPAWVRARHAFEQAGLPTYAAMQFADMRVLRGRGPLLKVGWRMGARSRSCERAFDELYSAHVAADVSFAYTRAAPTLDVRRPRASPYVVRDPAVRLLLEASDRPWQKIEAADRRAADRTVAHVEAILALLAAGTALPNLGLSEWTRILSAPPTTSSLEKHR